MATNLFISTFLLIFASTLVSIASSSSAPENVVTPTLRWTTFEQFNNSDWNIRQQYGNISSFKKPSDLDPKLLPLDANFTGNVWGGKRCSSDFSYTADLIPEICYKDITLRIKYYLETSHFGSSGMWVWPLMGQDGDVLEPQPGSPAVQWSQVSLRLDVPFLTCPMHASIDIFQDLGEDDILLFDEISLTIIDRRGMEKPMEQQRLRYTYK